jgi:hypothetical protein
MIISLCGFIGSGKGTVGDMLVEQGFVPLSFAGSLKDATASIFGWERALLEGDTAVSREFRETKDEFWSTKLGYEVTPRKVLQKFGTDCVRNHFFDDIWIASLERKITQHANVVITDVRFSNEIDFLYTLNSKLVQIDRKETRPKWYYLLEHNKAQLHVLSSVHPSEYDWFGNKHIEHVVDNDGSIEELKEKILKII